MDGGETDKSPNVVWHKPTVTRERREKLHGHKSFVLWFTGLSGSGKSTLAHAVEQTLHDAGVSTFVFDGDNVRHGLCSDLSFSEDDRKENIRRIGEMTKLFVEAGVVAMTAFISPFREERERVRSLFPHGDFIEVYCNCSLAVCETRDVKGLYAKARAGLIPNYTGISSPYEAPERAEIEVATDTQTLHESIALVMGYLTERGLMPA
jgi:adenylylsulfate kinase